MSWGTERCCFYGVWVGGEVMGVGNVQNTGRFWRARANWDLVFDGKVENLEIRKNWKIQKKRKFCPIRIFFKNFGN